MKRNKLIIIILFLITNVHCQTTTFNKLISPYINNPNTTAVSSSIITDGQAYIISGSIFDTLNNNYQSLYFYKLDSTANIIKKKIFSKQGINYYYNFASMLKTHDGEYLYAGDYDDSTNLFNNMIHFMIKFDSNLDTLWTKIIPHDTIWEAIRKVRETSDKGFIFVGDRGAGVNRTDVLLIKTDSVGRQLWRKIITMPNLSGGSSILETTDKGFLINGYSDSYTTREGDPFLIKTDSLGNLIWIKYLGGNEHDGPGAMAITNDGNILYAFGYSYKTYPFNHSYEAILYIIKFSHNGTVIWGRVYDTIRHRLYVSKILVLPNNDFIVMGSHSERDSANFFPSYLFKFNTNGDSLWRKTYFLVDHFGDMNTLNDNVLNADGGITACGWIIGDTLLPNQQIWLLKTDSNGYAPGPQNVGIIDLPYLQLSYGSLKLYPNPAATTICLSTTTVLKQGVVSIYNILGIKVMETQQAKAQNTFQLDISQLAKGYYKIILSDYGYIKGETSLLKE